MHMSELTALFTTDGLRLLDSLPAISSSDDVAREVTRLRAAGHTPDLVSAVVGQARLRTRAVAKFGAFASSMLFTQAGLEQATRLQVAALHAGRFRDAGVARVVDLGCGIGGDSLAFAGLGLSVLAVDADEVTAALAAFNLAPFGEAAAVRHAQAEDIALAEDDAAWLDPARRTGGHSETTRLIRSTDYTPSLDWAFELARIRPTGIKLGPGFDRETIPADAEAQWISVDGSTLELVLWFGALARPGVKRAALVMRGGESQELTAPRDSPDEGVRALGAYVHEPDGAIIRARLVGEVARAQRAGMLSPGIAYSTGDEAAPSPFSTTFRVREVLPFETKALARALRERGIGILEIKKRGVDVDPARLRTALKLRGTESAALILTRIAERRTALLVDRV